MASPQLDKGFARIANELLDALVRARFTATELRVLLAVLRRTYGRPGSPKVAPISVREIAGAVGCTAAATKRTVRDLIATRALVVSSASTPRSSRSIGIGKDYETWVFERVPAGDVSPATPQRGLVGDLWGTGGDPSEGTTEVPLTPSMTSPAKDLGARNTENTRKTRKTTTTACCARAAAPDPNVRSIIAAFHDAYVAACSEKPLIRGPKHGALVKSWLRQIPAEELTALIGLYFERYRAGDRFFDAPSLDHLLSSPVLERLRAIRRRANGTVAPEKHDPTKALWDDLMSGRAS